MKKNLEYKDEKSHKFWRIEVVENSFTVTYGKFGTNGQSKIKEFDTAEKANAEAEKVTKQKLKKGYKSPNEQIVEMNEISIVLKDDIDLDKLKIKTEPFSVSENIAYHKKGLEINGNLDLDYFDDDYRAEGLYVEGDLIVHGNIFGGLIVFIYVGGDLHVDTLDGIDADELTIVVQGNLYVKHFLITHEDSTNMTVNGNVYSGIRIHTPHTSYIENEIENTICFSNEEFSEIWNDIIYEDGNWDNFVKFNNGNDCDYDIGCPIDFVRKHWSFYKELWKKQNIFPEEILEEFLKDDYLDNRHVTKKDTSETFKRVIAFIEDFRKSKPSDKYCEDY